VPNPWPKAGNKEDVAAEAEAEAEAAEELEAKLRRNGEAEEDVEIEGDGATEGKPTEECEAEAGTVADRASHPLAATPPVTEGEWGV